MVNNPYPLPNDDLEKRRLEELQRCFRELIGTNIVPPIRNPTQIGKSVLVMAYNSGYRNGIREVGV